MSIEPIPLARETYLLPDHSFPEVTFLLETGQCHSWSYSEDQRETCIFSQDRRLVVTRGDHGLQFSGISPGDLNFWMAWFGWQPQQEEELRQGRERLSQDPALAGAIRHYPYMRILSQDPYEVLISFILSANNNMKRIHNSLFSLCHTLGDPKEAPDGEVFYSLPSPRALAQADRALLRSCGVGYRDRALQELGQRLESGEKSISKWKKMGDCDLEKDLLTLYGVGVKVARCIMLYGFHRLSAFPVDTWVKKALVKYYGLEDATLKEMNRFGEDHFGAWAGLAQQYLFEEIRRNPERLS